MSYVSDEFSKMTCVDGDYVLMTILEMLFPKKYEAEDFAVSGNRNSKIFLTARENLGTLVGTIEITKNQIIIKRGPDAERVDSL